MRAPLSWLKEFAPIDADLDVLVPALDDLGLIVEGVERVGEGLEEIVVVRVLEVAPIEGADRATRSISVSHPRCTSVSLLRKRR